jgi:hypothetical protein
VTRRYRHGDLPELRPGVVLRSSDRDRLLLEGALRSHGDVARTSGETMSQSRAASKEERTPTR